MMDWFMAGGYGMFTVLALAAGSIAYAARTMGDPTAARLSVLRALPALLVTSALFAFGTNLWAVNVHLRNDAFLKAHDVAESQATLIGILGFTEAAQVLTLGGLLATLLLVLRIVAEGRHAHVDAARA
jgi:hypothetical protein